MKDSRQYSRSPMEKKHKCGCFSHIPDLGKNKDSELGEITWFFLLSQSQYRGNRIVIVTKTGNQRCVFNVTFKDNSFLPAAANE